MSEEAQGAATTTADAAQTTTTEAKATTDGTGSVTTGAATQDPAATTTEAGDAKPGEQKADDGKTKEGNEKKPADDKPIEYADFKLPEGVKVDDETLGQAKAIFAEAKLPQDQAQKFVDLYAGKLKAAAEAPYKQWQETQEKWVSEIKADPEIGGDKLQGAVAAAAKALDHPALKVPGLRDALIFTGAGNHPAVLKFFARVGKAVSADSFAMPGGSAPAPKSAAELFYPTMHKE